jgi:dTDP-4-amino-4,6-dideoxygalactose transaminase
MIPVQRPYLGKEELEAVGRVFDSRWLGLGATTKEFEDELRKLLGVKHVIAVNTGTSALHLALDSVGIGPGDEVIVPSLTFVASVQAIVACGAKPVFCEIEEDTLNIDVADALGRVTERTAAIMPVHYGGLACDMDPLLAFCRQRNIRLVEDAAHAFGSSYKGRPIGSFGDVACFSFDPIKNITTGEGGAIVTNDDEVAGRAVPKRILGINNDTWSRYRNERNWFYEVITPGYRYHMPNINAAIGLQQLKRFDVFRTRKQEIVRRYDRAFGEVPSIAVLRHDIDEMFPFSYVVRVMDGKRDDLMTFLKERGIATGVHYIPNHIQPLFRDSHAALPVTERVFEQMVTLPLYYEMTDADVLQVIEGVLAFAAEHVA